MNDTKWLAMQEGHFPYKWFVTTGGSGAIYVPDEATAHKIAAVNELEAAADKVSKAQTYEELVAARNECGAALAKARSQ